MQKNIELSFDNPEYANLLFGPMNMHLEFMEGLSNTYITSTGSDLVIKPQNKQTTMEEMQNVAHVFTQCYGLIKKGSLVKTDTLEHAYSLLTEQPNADIGRIFSDYTVIKAPKKTIIARNVAQKKYIDLMQKNEIVFGIGPAGTGKTYLAVAMALNCLMAKKVKKIILTRPAVEAGEKLGFLPGTLTEKVDPYLRPLFDALDEMLGHSQFVARQEAGMIEIAPLAFMRGRTLSDAFLILDEAQNTTPEQMKMFLTRMGFGSRMVITGDVTQIDLPPTPLYDDKYAKRVVRSGLVHTLEVLKHIPGIGIYNFSNADVVRHYMVSRIVQAYDSYENKTA